MKNKLFVAKFISYGGYQIRLVSAESIEDVKKNFNSDWKIELLRTYDFGDPIDVNAQDLLDYGGNILISKCDF